MNGKNHDFNYKIGSVLSCSDDFIEVEKEFLKNSKGVNSYQRLLKILVDGRKFSNKLVKYLVEQGKKFLREHNVKDAILIIFKLDSYSDKEFDDLEKVVMPQKFLANLLHSSLKVQESNVTA
ncbi:MAG: hypothetical protein ACTSVY_12565 [Candidatus Helarchaeota archaeon]